MRELKHRSEHNDKKTVVSESQNSRTPEILNREHKSLNLFKSSAPLFHVTPRNLRFSYSRNVGEIHTSTQENLSQNRQLVPVSGDWSSTGRSDDFLTSTSRLHFSCGGEVIFSRDEYGVEYRRQGAFPGRGERRGEPRHHLLHVLRHPGRHHEAEGPEVGRLPHGAQGLAQEGGAAARAQQVPVVRVPQEHGRRAEVEEGQVVVGRDEAAQLRAHLTHVPDHRVHVQRRHEVNAGRQDLLLVAIGEAKLELQRLVWQQSFVVVYALDGDVQSAFRAKSVEISRRREKNAETDAMSLHQFIEENNDE